MKDIAIEFDEIKFDSNFGIRQINKLGEGSYGQTWLVKYSQYNDAAEEIDAVIKVLKPYETTRPGVNPRQDFIEEVRFLQRLRHPGIVRIIGRGNCQIGDFSSHYYISEYENALPLDKYIDKYAETITLKDIFRLAERILDPLAYCHKNDVIHLDLKLDNILVKELPDNRVGDICDCIIIDFGKAKRMNEHIDVGKTTVGGGAYEYVHPDLREYLRSNIVNKQVFCAPEAQRFDLYSVGIVLIKIIEKAKVFKKSDGFKYLELLIDKLKNIDDERFYSEDALRVLKNNHGYETGHKSIKCRVVGVRTLSYSSEVQRVIESPEFQRLRDIKQLGLTSYVYPSATHTRLSHSLGTYERSKMYVQALQRHHIFRFKYSNDELVAFNLYALLHDIGHYPFAHYLEELGVSKLNLNHSHYTEQILKGKLCSSDSVCDIADVVKSVTGFSGDQIIENIQKDSLLRSIIDGNIDCDKLDYLIRDGIACGVPYANSIDVDRFISSLTCVEGYHGKYRIGVTSKGVSAVETILLARYQLFSEVYWHKACRSIASMIKQAFFIAYTHNVITQGDMDHAALNLGDNEFLLWLFHKVASVNLDAANDLIGNSILSKKRSLYKRLETYSSVWDDDGADDSPYKVITECCTNKSSTNEMKKAIVSKLNQSGKSTSGWENIKDHQVILDIPPAHKDVQSGIYVNYEDDVLGRKNYPMHEVSSFLKTMGKEYLQATKKARIFVHPSKIDQILNLKHCKTILREAISTSKKQLPIAVP